MAKSNRRQLERAEGRALMQLVGRRWWAPYLHHSPNEDLDHRKRQIAAGQGTSPGFPDYVLTLRRGPFVGCAIELKAPKPHGRAPSPEQREWLERLEGQDWYTVVAYGADQALAEFLRYVAFERGGA